MSVGCAHVRCGMYNVLITNVRTLMERLSIGWQSLICQMNSSFVCALIYLFSVMETESNVILVNNSYSYSHNL